MHPQNIKTTRTYTNPVYADYFADPFVWEYNGEYYAVGTGPMEAAGQVEDGEKLATGLLAQLRVFPLLRSDDFVTWHNVGGALLPLDPEYGDAYWAPEVAYCDGNFYLYYSVGHADRGHQLRVAVSNNPQGPYEDTGKTLVNPAVFPFAIDPHPFQDDDGQWYLFYARDFLDTEDGARAGTALMVDRMLDMTTLAGEAKTVLRARSEWQRFLKDRTMYDQVWDWHTLEGPCVRKHEGRYYCFYSGGRWETEQYGVDYGVADQIMGPYSDEGNEAGARVLRTVPGHVTGPGHNSIVVGPDRHTEFLAYHAWNPSMTERRMCLDRLIWTPDGPRCAGPTWTPQTIEAVTSWQSQL
jgi:beta-xylosidase